MLKKIATVVIAVTMLAQPAIAGVSGIQQDGRSASGKTMYKVTCSSGKTWRIYQSSGQWYDGTGAQGGQSRNLNEQAAFLCG
jgi:hypothetical protein